MTANLNKSVLHVAEFVDSMDPGGAEEVVLSLAAGLPEHGIRVTVMHFGNAWITQQTKARGLDSLVLDRRHYKSVWTLPLFARSFAALLRDRQVSVLHSHLLGAVFAGALAARRAGIPSIGTLHDIYSLHESSMHPRYVRWAHKSGSRLVAVCDAMRGEVERVSRISRLDRIYNGIDVSRYASSPESTPHRPVRIICAARAVPIKRLDLLLRAFAEIDGDTPAEMHIVGDGPLLPELGDLAKKLGIGEHVSFLGHRDDVPALLADSDIYALVSDSEGMSVSVLESMAAGLPAVVTDVGGNRELVVDGESGWVVSRGDLSGVADALATLVTDRELRSRFGALARKRAGETFTLAAMCEQYANRLRLLVNHG